MLRISLTFLMLAAAAFGQAAAPAPTDALQALLSEVHQLRMDLQATTVTSQRVQILLYRVQLQQAATSRAASRVDDARAALADAQKQHNHATEVIQSVQDKAARNVDPKAAKEMEAMLAEFKYRVDSTQTEEQQCQSRAIEAETHLRSETAKLSELQDTLDRLDKALAKLSGQ